jgi:hypothetical protein
MKRMNNPTLASKNEDLDRIVARAWPGRVAQNFSGPTSSPPQTVYRRAVEEADARLHERQHPLRGDVSPLLPMPKASLPGTGR